MGFLKKKYSPFGPAVGPALANINILAWEPSAAHISHSYSRRRVLERFYRETKFSLLSRPTQLES